MLTEIPVVDLAKITRADSSESDWDEKAKEIEFSLSQTGFVYITSHGIPESTIQNAFDLSKQFFTLPKNRKLKYEKNLTRVAPSLLTFQDNNGHTSIGKQLEGTATYEHKESFDVCNNVRFFPSEEDVPGFGSTFTALEKGLQQLTLRIVKLLGLALGLKNPEFFSENLRHITDPNVQGTTILRSLYYPATAEVNMGANSTRCDAHTDYGFITFLMLQLGDPGLQVKIPNGDWIFANPIKGAILLNTADFLELWSNNHFPATVHQVCLPTEKKHREAARQSIAYFVNPDDEATVSALDTKFSGEMETRNEVWNAYDRYMLRLRKAYGA